MTTKTKSEPVVVDDLRTLRAALDAPARERAAAEAREREAEQRQRQDHALRYARGIAEKLAPALAAIAAGQAAPVDMTALRATFGEGVPLWRAWDAVAGATAAIESTARVAGQVAALVPELEGPTLLPAARLETILRTLDSAAGRAEGWAGVYAAWIRTRGDAAALIPPLLNLAYALRRRWKPSEAECALLAQQQQRLAEAAAAMPPVPPKAPRRGVPGANFDAATTSPQSRRPLLENLAD